MQLLRKISAIVFSTLVLFSSMSFTLGMHFCMGQLQSIALFSEAESCEGAPEKVPFSAKIPDYEDSERIAGRGCCEDHIVVVEGSEELNIASTIVLPDFGMVVAFLARTSDTSTSLEIDFHSNIGYSPPIIERNITVLIQSFLI